MKNTQNRKIIKTVSLIAAASVFANVSNAWFWDKPESVEERPMRVTPEGQLVPAEQESWLQRATTYHEELKPEYDPKTQRVRMPTSPINNGVNNNTDTSTVKPAWYDRATTYHAEQRRPWNPYDLEEKKIPAYMYYDRKEAEAYNEHYGQQDLKPVPYMYGSASLVLRKEAQADDFALAKGENLDGLREFDSNNPADARMVGMDGVYIRPAGGFEGVDYRDAQNQMAKHRSNNIMLSDPLSADQDVTNYNNVMIGNPKEFDVQVATKIDEPKSDWRTKLDYKPNLARPGDFDYKQKAPAGSTAQAYQGASAGEYGYDNFAQPTQAQYQQAEQMPSYMMEDGGQVLAATGGVVDSYGSNKVNSYTVENGDTLSQISEKEKVYGDWTLWPLIYDANRSQINDPDLIEPGQNLGIPRDYDYQQEQDARYRSTNRETPISLFDGR